MSSLKRIPASRANGARSRGSTTRAGKQASTLNALRHGLLAKCVVLATESRADFDMLLDQHIQRFSPIDDVELGVIEELVASLWRVRRTWAIETRLHDDAVATREPGDELGRLAGAFTDLALSPQLDLLHRYEARLHHMSQRALENICLLRNTPPSPNQPTRHEPLQPKFRYSQASNMNKTIVALDLAPPAVKAGQEVVRRRNTWRLLHLIQTGGPSSQAELAQRSGLSKGSVCGILQPLIRKRILAQERKLVSHVGRKTTVFGFNPYTTLVAGVCIDREECEVALVDLSARVIDHASATYPRHTEPHEVVALAVSRIEALAKRNRVDSLIGAGVAIPGLVDPGSGLVRVATNLGWHNVQLQALFEQRLQLPVRVENLGRAKARAEATWGRGIGYRNFVCLEIGSSIGAGVMVDGQILRGAGALAGEVGHTLFDPRGPRCACGLNGCWEMFCAGPAIRRRLGERLALDGESGSALSPAATIRDLGQAAEQGDPAALRVVAETAEILARGLGSIVWNFDPGLIILSGPVVRDCPSLVEATRSSLGALKALRKFDMPLLAAAQEPDAGVIAASAVVLFLHLEELAKRDAPGAVNPDGEALVTNLADR